VIADDAIHQLLSYSWPGNVRELRNVLDRAIRDYPDVEQLVGAHLTLQYSPNGTRTSVGATEKSDAHSGPDTGLTFVLGENTHVTLSGQLAHVLERNLEQICSYMAKCLELTRKAPDQLNITAAAKLMTGRRHSRLQAADLIKRSLKVHKEDISIRERILQKIPIVQEALTLAESSRRPSGPDES